MKYVYRGTTIGWPGNPVLQELRLTPVTSDPLVAALFAIESIRHGASVVYVARMADVASHLAPPNVLAGIEHEYAVAVAPMGFIERFVVHQFRSDEIRPVFHELAIELPATIANRFRLLKELEHYSPLSESQISFFDAKITAAES